LPSVSSSSLSAAFFFLLAIALLVVLLLGVGWLLSRALGKDEVGVGAWDGVVCVEFGVEESCRKELKKKEHF